MKKKLALLIIAFILSINAIAQQVSLSELVARHLPAGTEQLNKEQLVSFANQEGFDVSVIQSKPEHMYKFGHILIALFDFKDQYPENYIQQKKVSSDRTWRKHSEYTSTLKAFDNYQIFISSYEINNTIKFRFTSINNQKTQILNGIIQCKKEDIDKARQLVNNLVEHIPF